MSEESDHIDSFRNHGSRDADASPIGFGIDEMEYILFTPFLRNAVADNYRRIVFQTADLFVNGGTKQEFSDNGAKEVIVVLFINEAVKEQTAVEYALHPSTEQKVLVSNRIVRTVYE